MNARSLFGEGSDDSERSFLFVFGVRTTISMNLLRPGTAAVAMPGANMLAMPARAPATIRFAIVIPSVWHCDDPLPSLR